MRNVFRTGTYRCWLALAACFATLNAARATDVRWRGSDERATPPVSGVRQELARVRHVPRRCVVEFATPATNDLRCRLAAHGITLLRPLGEHAYFATVQPGATPPAGDVVTAVYPIQATWKLHPQLQADAVRAAQDVVLNVMLHADAAIMADGIVPVEDLGGHVLAELWTLNALVIVLPAAQIDALALHDAVQWIEPALPPMSSTNNANRVLVGVDVVSEAPYDLDGSGVVVMVYDSGTPAAGHPDLGGRVHVRDSSGTRTHASSVAGTIGGSGVQSAGTYRGMAPGVTFECYGFQDDDWQPGFLYSDPGDLQDDYDEAFNTYAAVLANNSIGTNVEVNLYDCTWQGDYGVTSALIDSIVAGSLGVSARVVWSAGNERAGDRCDIEGFGDYYSLAPPACAKNPLVVGAVDAIDEGVSSASSWGPTDDGRLKPDIVAPGCQRTDDFGVTSCNSGSGYTTYCNSSMATATVTGIAALLIEDYRDLYPTEPDPLNATIKALLIHTAADQVAADDNAGPDFRYGYGSLRAQAAVDQLRSGAFRESMVDQGEVAAFDVYARPGDTQVRVTLVWDDAAGTPNVLPALVNDLDLRVIDPNGGVHYPWTLDPNDPSAPAMQTVADHRNNVEQVVVENAGAGIYRVEVHGFAVTDGPQSCAMCFSPVLLSCSSMGTVALDRAAYACEATTVVWVTDCDLDVDVQSADVVNVTLMSDSEPVGEIVELVETGVSTGVFTGSLDVSETDTPGVLWIAPGETITASYIDADDGQGGSDVVVTTTAAVDCAPPSISDVSVEVTGARTATIAFTTDEDAQGVVHYGTSCGALTMTEVGVGFTTSHTMTLEWLDPNRVYAFAVEAVDMAGNVTIDDAAGACYDFVTPEVSEYYTEAFDADLDLDGYAVLFTPAGASYMACADLIVALPTEPYPDPNVGTWERLYLPDDGYELVEPNVSLPFFGVDHDVLYVGSNGYVTFTAGDTTHLETLGEHFALPRVAGLFEDLSPQNGWVSWRALEDRVVVTWDRVPNYGTSNENTFQVELYRDGRIRVAWLGLDATSGIVGLSDGSGYAPDFVPTDLSALAACGARPPVAVDVDVTAYDYHDVTIGLEASDDGEPDPPGALSYVITSLPEYELRDAGDFHEIVADDLPYTLVDGGNEVIYRRFNPYHAVDSFTFQVDDGGASPAGGLSNVATALVTLLEPQLVYAFPLDVDPNWVCEGLWEFGVPLGGGSFIGDPDEAYTGAHVYGYNLAGDYENDLEQTSLTTATFDFSAYERVELRYWRWLAVEDATFDSARVQISTDGEYWSTVWAHTGDALEDAAWTQQVIDVSARAGGESAVQFRWCMGPTDQTNTYAGWNIDDVEIWGVIVHPVGDLDCNNRVDYFDIQAFLAAILGESEYYAKYPDCNRWFADTNDDGQIDYFDINGFLDLLGT